MSAGATQRAAVCLPSFFIFFLMEKSKGFSRACLPQEQRTLSTFYHFLLFSAICIRVVRKVPIPEGSRSMEKAFQSLSQPWSSKEEPPQQGYAPQDSAFAPKGCHLRYREICRPVKPGEGGGGLKEIRMSFKTNTGRQSQGPVAGQRHSLLITLLDWL